jgi:hypothetical protein
MTLPYRHIRFCWLRSGHALDLEFIVELYRHQIEKTEATDVASDIFKQAPAR